MQLSSDSKHFTVTVTFAVHFSAARTLGIRRKQGESARAVAPKSPGDINPQMADLSLVRLEREF